MPESNEHEVYREIARRKQAEASVERMRALYEQAEVGRDAAEARAREVMMRELGHLETIKELRRSVDAAEARAVRAEEALREIAETSAVSMGFKSQGHAMAVATRCKVIARAALAAVDEPPPGWCFKCKRQFGMFDTCGDDNCPSAQAVDEPPLSEAKT